MNALALAAENVSFTYATVPVLQNVTCSAQYGKFLGIVGPNGAGKSTLLKVFTGYLDPFGGNVSVFGNNVQALTRRQIAQKLAFVTQKSSATFHFRVLDIVLMGRHPYSGLSSFDSSVDVEVAQAALEELSISTLAEKVYDQLSGGEQQLVMLAQALAQQPQIFVLDEPTTFLDLAHQLRVFKLLKKKCAAGAAVVATFHDLNAAARWCDQLLLLSSGSVAGEGSPAEVLQRDLLQEVYNVPLQVEHQQGRVRVELPDD